MKIEGAKPGQFKGEAKEPGRSQWIPVVAVALEPESQREAATGLASGKRQHKPIRITKELGASSAQLQEALAHNEHLKEVVIQFVRRDLQGKEEVYRTITLTDAAIAAIQRPHEPGAKNKSNQHELEEISFTYEKIQVTYPQANNGGANTRGPK
jgi:type VI secretion system secreted protein Hcp